jgi:uncharacterized protein (TIRG00374 family)
MGSTIKTALKFIIPLVLAGLLSWYQFGDKDMSKVIHDVSQANIYWVLLTIVISLLAHLSRAYRWNLLMEPLGYKPKLKNTFLAVMTGYFGNILAPRFGEVLRCITLNKIDRVPMNSALGSVVAERAFDFLCLLTLIGLSLILEFERFSKLFLDIFTQKLKGLNQNLIVGIIIALVVLTFIAFIFRATLNKISIINKVVTFIKTIILEAAGSFRRMKRKGSFLLHTFIIWICYYLMTYLMFFSLDSTSHLAPMAGLVILIIGGLGMSAPVTGGFGLFHEMVAGGLTLFYGLDSDSGLAYAVVIHESQFLTYLFIGGACALVTLWLSRKQKAIAVI